MNKLLYFVTLFESIKIFPLFDVLKMMLASQVKIYDSLNTEK